jgi:hypothetical protein
MKKRRKFIDVNGINSNLEESYEVGGSEDFP